MQYVCPNVDCQTTWNITENSFLGGIEFPCGSCNTTSQIPLHCPQCNLKNSVKKSFLDHRSTETADR